MWLVLCKIVSRFAITICPRQTIDYGITTADGDFAVTKLKLIIFTLCIYHPILYNSLYFQGGIFLRRSANHALHLPSGVTSCSTIELESSTATDRVWSWGHSLNTNISVQSRFYHYFLWVNHSICLPFLLWCFCV